MLYLQNAIKSGNAECMKWALAQCDEILQLAEYIEMYILPIR